MRRLIPLLFLLLVACSKAPAPVPVLIPAPVPPSAVVDTRIELEKMGAVKMVAAPSDPAPVPVVVAVVEHKPMFNAEAEAAAYAKAYRNAAIANQLLGEHRFRTA
jgi:hypothetical protein